jgi:hypothetical protein
MKTLTLLSGSLLKRISAVVLFGTIVSTGLFAQKADFSGTYTFNEGKSQMGEGRFRAPASKLVIAQSDSVMTLEKTGKDMNGGDVVTKEKYYLNGKTSENTGFMNSVKKSTIAWAADNKSLTINSSTIMERDGNTMETKAIEIYSLAADGKSLTINSTSTSQRGERKQTLVYDK